MEQLHSERFKSNADSRKERLDVRFAPQKRAKISELADSHGISQAAVVRRLTDLGLEAMQK